MRINSVKIKRLSINQKLISNYFDFSQSIRLSIHINDLFVISFDLTNTIMQTRYNSDLLEMDTCVPDYHS